jgi:hypothetical protein
MSRLCYLSGSGSFTRCHSRRGTPKKHQLSFLVVSSSASIFTAPTRRFCNNARQRVDHVQCLHADLVHPLFSGSPKLVFSPSLLIGYRGRSVSLVGRKFRRAPRDGEPDLLARILSQHTGCHDASSIFIVCLVSNVNFRSSYYFRCENVSVQWRYAGRRQRQLKNAHVACEQYNKRRRAVQNGTPRWDGSAVYVYIESGSGRLQERACIVRGSAQLRTPAFFSFISFVQVERHPYS